MKEGQEDLASQKLRDRYYGVNDPVAKRILNRVNESAVAPPADKDIKTLYIGNIDPKITEVVLLQLLLLPLLILPRLLFLLLFLLFFLLLLLLISSSFAFISLSSKS